MEMTIRLIGFLVLILTQLGSSTILPLLERNLVDLSRRTFSNVTRSIEFRPIRPEEIKPFLERRWEFQLEENPHPITVNKKEFLSCSRSLSHIYEEERFTHFAAFSNTSIISTASIYRVPMLPRPWRIEDKFGYLTNVYTVPGFRNKGIGTTLIQTVIQWATTKDLELILVWPSEQSIPFYTRLGFNTRDHPMTLQLRPY